MKHAAAANTSSPRADPTAGVYYQDEYTDLPHAVFDKVKYAPKFEADEIQFSSVPRYSSSYGQEAYTAQAF